VLGVGLPWRERIVHDTRPAPSHRPDSCEVRGHPRASWQRARQGTFPATGIYVERIHETELVTVGGVCLFAIHDLQRLNIESSASGIRVVVSGHSHKPLVTQRQGVLFVNPGSAGPRRFKLPISVAELIIANDGSISARTVELEVHNATYCNPSAPCKGPRRRRSGFAWGTTRIATSATRRAHFPTAPFTEQPRARSKLARPTCACGEVVRESSARKDTEHHASAGRRLVSPAAHGISRLQRPPKAGGRSIAAGPPAGVVGVRASRGRCSPRAARPQAPVAGGWSWIQ